LNLLKIATIFCILLVYHVYILRIFINLFWLLIITIKKWLYKPFTYHLLHLLVIQRLYFIYNIFLITPVFWFFFSNRIWFRIQIFVVRFELTFLLNKSKFRSLYILFFFAWLLFKWSTKDCWCVSRHLLFLSTISPNTSKRNQIISAIPLKLSDYHLEAFL